MDLISLCKKEKYSREKESNFFTKIKNVLLYFL